MLLKNLKTLIALEEFKNINAFKKLKTLIALEEFKILNAFE